MESTKPLPVKSLGAAQRTCARMVMSEYVPASSDEIPRHGSSDFTDDDISA